MFGASTCWMGLPSWISNLCCLGFRLKSCAGGGWRKLRRDRSIDVERVRNRFKKPQRTEQWNPMSRKGRETWGIRDSWTSKSRTSDENQVVTDSSLLLPEYPGWR